MPTPRSPPMPDPAIRLAVVDDDDDFRLLMASLCSLDDRFDVVGEATHAAEARRVAGEVAPELVTIDFELPGADGPDLIAALRGILPDAVLVVVTGHERRMVEGEALGAGADSCLVKENPAGLLDQLYEITKSPR